MSVRSSSDSTRLLRSRPSITLSLASSRSRMSTACLLRRAASSAASLTTLDSSAPDSPAVPRAGVDLVDENDARRVGFALLEQVAHPRGAHTHEHLHEVRAGHREEG